MKRKLLTTLFALCSIVGLMGFVACDDDKNSGNSVGGSLGGGEHVHTYEYQQPVNPTCTTEGIKAHYACSCGEIFDINQNPVAAELLSIPSIAHSVLFTEGRLEGHRIPCADHFRCENCGTAFADEEGTVTLTQDESTFGYKHSLTRIEANPASCNSMGNVAYYQCEICRIPYVDEEGKTVGMGENDVFIAPTGHTFSNEWTIEWDSHYRTATCEHTDETSDRGSHVYNQDGVCVCGDNINFVFHLSQDETSYTVFGREPNQANLTIPSSYNGLPVTAIGEYAFDNLTELQSVTIPDSVTTIWDNAFSGSGLTSIVIPNSVTTVSYSAFRDCTALSTVRVGTGLTSIRESAFYGCSNLTGVYITDLAKWCAVELLSNPLSYAHNLYVNDVLITELSIPDGVTNIQPSAFEGCNHLTSVTLPDSVITIGERAFGNCGEITSVTLGDKVTSIGDSAFYACGKLATLSMVSATSIGGSAFNGCYSLQEVVIPEGVTEIGDSAFEGCSNLSKLTLPSTLLSIGASAFEGARISQLYLSDLAKWCGVEIGHKGWPFYNNYASGSFQCNLYVNDALVTELNIPEGVKTIKANVFENFTEITKITLPSSLESIERYAFWCENLQGVYINDLASWCAINFEADSNPLYNSYPFHTTNFYVNNVLVEDLHIPDGVTEIKPYAFYGCDTVTSVSIPNGVTTIGKNAFASCQELEEINIPNSVTTIGNGIFSTSSVSVRLKIRWLSGVEPTYEILGRSIGSYLTLDRTLSSTETTVFNVPDGFTSLTYAMFEGLTNLQELYIPDSVTTIEVGAFKDLTSLQKLSLPTAHNIILGFLFGIDAENGVLQNTGTTTANLFAIPSTLTNVTIRDGIIKDFYFNGCTMLTSYDFTNAKEIGEFAFYNTGLTSIHLPSSLTSVEQQAFENCKNLTTVTMDKEIPAFGDSQQFYILPLALFKDCTALTTLVLSPNMVNSESFEDNVGLKVYYYDELLIINADMTDSENHTDMYLEYSDYENATFYQFSETEQVGCWHYVNGVPTIW